MKRLRALALVVMLVGSTAAVPLAAGQSTGDDTIVTVDVSATPDPAAPGTNVTVSTTVENVVENARTYTVQRVELREGRDDNSTLVDRTSPTDRVQGGERGTYNLSEEFGETGSFQRYVHIQIISPSGNNINLVRPVTVDVEQTHPSMSLTGGDIGPDGDATFTLTLANGLPADVRGLTVDLSSSSLALADDRRVVSSLAPGQEATVEVTAANVSAGSHTVTADLSYVTADGEARSVTRELSTTTADSQAGADVRLTGISVDRRGDVLSVSGNASNLGETNASGVLVSIGDGDGVAPAQNQAEQFVGTVDGGDVSRFGVNARLTGSSDTVTIPVALTYTVNGERVTRTTRVDYRVGEGGTVSLTDVSIERYGSELRISGRASNLGSANASSVLVAVGEGQQVSPAPNQPESFVGTVPASGAASFAVNASLAADAEGSVTIPVEVSYEIGGDRVARTTELTYTPEDAGNVTLTGVRVEQQGRQLVVRGSTSNLGEINASGVVVSIAEGEAVGPAQSQSEYFVGTVQASDFSSFEAHAALTEQTNETVQIPVEVSYSVNGERTTRTVTVDYTPRTLAQSPQPQQSSLGGLLPIVGLVVVVVLAGLGYRRYR